jgi:hypothetical protein
MYSKWEQGGKKCKEKGYKKKGNEVDCLINEKEARNKWHVEI